MTYLIIGCLYYCVCRSDQKIVSALLGKCFGLSYSIFINADKMRSKNITFHIYDVNKKKVSIIDILYCINYIF